MKDIVCKLSQGKLCWLWFSILAGVLLSGCGSLPTDRTGIYIVAIWKQGDRAMVQLNPKLKELSPRHFPLKLSIGPLDPKMSLPPGEGSTEYSLTLEGWKSKLAVKVFPSEAGFVLRSRQGEFLDRIVFVAFPEQAVLHRSESKEEFCEKSAWLSTKICKPLQRTEPLTRLRHIRSLDEFRALSLARGSLGLQTQAVKFLIDLRRDNLTHFIQAATWDLHYTFYREEIESKPKLDRCNKDQEVDFQRGWHEFSQTNYSKVEGREFFLGTLLLYSGTQVMSLEFATGDTISGEQMLIVYHHIRRHLDPRIRLQIRPTSPQQDGRLRKAAPGFAEIMPMDKPYQNTSVQLLSPGVAYGTLRAFSNLELAKASLGIRVIAVLKEVPNDINFVGGVVSSQFQSSLSHINVLSRNRGTPHLVLRNPMENPKLAGLWGKLVRLEVTDSGYSLTQATRKDAEAFWKKREASRQPFTPSLNLNVKEMVNLKDAKIEMSESIGAKAANLAELGRVDIGTMRDDSTCKRFADHGLARIPEQPFAIPFYWYMDHIQRAGVDKQLQTLHQDQHFLQNPEHRREQLSQIRKQILNAPVNPNLLALLQQEIQTRFGTRKVRFRSSTNVEDLPDFNGAGLYHSQSVQLGHPKKTIEAGLRNVWASLWRERAWNERTFYKVAHLKSAMGILMHPSFPDEDANGVAVSTNIFSPDPGNWDTYIAVQQGETSIVNPKGSSTPDQFLIRWFNPAEMFYLSRSSLTAGLPVLQREESLLLGCYMRAIQSHFRPFFEQKGKRFAMEAEFKIDGAPRKLYLKQTRPYVFGESKPPTHCKK